MNLTSPRWNGYSFIGAAGGNAEIVFFGRTKVVVNGKVGVRRACWILQAECRKNGSRDGCISYFYYICLKLMHDMSIPVELVIRLLAAGAAGAVIGYERELRGKSAGMRTHLLVALGSALFMIISQHGFAGTDKFDAARIAAAVVGGLGFLGGGIIMKNRHVSGLTTAAGLWVTGAIGLGIGCGLYEVSILCLVIILACMEAMYFYDFRLGDKNIHITASGPDRDQLLNNIASLGRQVQPDSITRLEDGRFQIEASLLIKKRDFPAGILKKIDSIPGLTLDSLE